LQKRHNMTNSKKRKIFDQIAPTREKFSKINHYYHEDLRDFYTFHIPIGKRVLELGCGKGDLLALLRPSFGVGVDFSIFHIEKARMLHPECHFILGDAEDLPVSGKFDYIIMYDLLESLDDIQNTLTQLQSCCHPGTRIICNFFNYLWEPVLKFGEWAGMKTPNPESNWLSVHDMENLFYLSGFETISRGYRMLFPRKVPLFSYFLNRVLAILPIFRNLCMWQYLVIRPQPALPADWKNKYSVSIIIPTRDELGNIPGCFERMPKMGKWTELIFVDAESTDGTIEAINDGISKHSARWKRILLISQGGKFGKGDAVRKAFSRAKGDILMVLDSDLTMPPEDLPKYYEAISTGRGEVINGCRLVYPFEGKAMRSINYFGNKTFSAIFSWLLDQHIKDTLCGTKVLWRIDYELISQSRDYFGDFDPFGDFDLLFGASKLDRKIVDLPIRYRNRTYGDIKIERWKHAMLLFRMCGIAFYRLKLQHKQKHSKS